MLAADTIPICSRDVVTRRDARGVLLFQVRTDEMHFISDGGYALFTLCDGSRTVSQIEGLLALKQPALATPEAREQIEQFIESLAERQIVELWR